MKFINTNLFIKQEANQSEDKIKYYLSLYFSDYDDDIFRDNSTKNGFSKNIYNKIDDKILLKKSFIKTRKNNWNTTVYQMPRKIVRKLSLLKNNLIDNSRKETVLEKNINTNLKEYLNVGAHPLWRHPNCVSLDFVPELSEVSFDLDAGEITGTVGEKMDFSADVDLSTIPSVVIEEAFFIALGIS